MRENLYGLRIQPKIVPGSPIIAKGALHYRKYKIFISSRKPTCRLWVPAKTQAFLDFQRWTCEKGQDLQGWEPIGLSHTYLRLKFYQYFVHEFTQDKNIINWFPIVVGESTWSSMWNSSFNQVFFLCDSNQARVLSEQDRFNGFSYSFNQNLHSFDDSFDQEAKFKMFIKRFRFKLSLSTYLVWSVLLQKIKWLKPHLLFFCVFLSYQWN